MDGPGIPCADLAPRIRKKVHISFLKWHRFSVSRVLKTKVAIRKHRIRRGINEFKRSLQWRRAVSFHCHMTICNAFREWKRKSATLSRTPLQFGVQVLFCYKLISYCFSDGPTYSFPWAGVGYCVDKTAAQKSASRYRHYALGKLHLPGKNLPLFIHSLALMDAYQLRHSFSCWKSYVEVVRSLRQRPHRKVLDAWKSFTAKRLSSRIAEKKLIQKMCISTAKLHFWKWKTGFKVMLGYKLLDSLRVLRGLWRWKQKAVLNSNPRHARNTLVSAASLKALSVSFKAWNYVWLQRVRLQRVSNRVVCNRFRILTRDAWALWRGFYNAIMTYRKCTKKRLHDAVGTLKCKKRERKYLLDREIKRACFRKWILLYSSRVRAQHIIAVWSNFHRRRKLTRALRHWILLFSVETIAICVQKTWRGYAVRFIEYRDVWSRVKW